MPEQKSIRLKQKCIISKVMVLIIIVAQNLHLANFCYTRKLDQFQIGGHVDFAQSNLFEAVNQENNF